MPKRLSYLALAMLSLAFALPSHASPPGSILPSWDYDTAKKLVIHLTNTSGKDITGFVILVTVTHPDGSADTLQKGTDFVSRMASAAVSRAEGGPQETGAFAPGTTYDVPAPETQNVKDVSIAVEVTTYADGTAESNNPFMFHHFLVGRQGMLIARQRANDALKSAATKDEAVKQLESLANIAETKGHGAQGGSPNDPENHTELGLRLILSDLKHQTDLQTLIRENDIKIAVYSAHVNLKEVRQ